MNTVRWDLAGKCNLNCAHCVVGKIDFGNDLGLDESKMLIDKFVQDGYKHIQLVIKEPFFHRNIYDIIRYLRINNFTLSIITNGTCISNQVLDELFNANINYLAVSLDGLSKSTNDEIRGIGSYDRTINFLDRVKNRNTMGFNYIPIILQICMTPQNIHEIDEQLLTFVSTYKFVSVSLGNIHDAGNASDNHQILMTTEEYSVFAEDIIKKTSTIRPQLSVIWKDMLPYDAIYFNLKYGTDIRRSIPYCSMFSGHFSVLPDGRLCRCSLLIGVGLLPDKENIFDTNYLYSSNIQIENLDLQYRLDQTGYCTSCRFADNCFPCLFCGDGTGSIKPNIEKSCENRNSQIQELIDDILFGRRAFLLRSDSSLSSDDDNIRISAKSYDPILLKTTYNSNLMECLLLIHGNPVRMNEDLDSLKPHIELLVYSDLIRLSEERTCI